MAEAWIASHKTDWENKTWITLALTPRKDDTQPPNVMGAISLMLHIAHHRAELAYWLGTPYWNQGYMTESAHTLVQYGFEELKLNRVEATHYRSNPASGRVMQKIGMQQERFRRQQTLRFGQFEDCVVYRLRASDWELEKSKHQQQR